MTRATAVAPRRRLAVLALAGGLVWVSPAGAVEPVTRAAGHVDYAARIVDGALRSQVKDGTGSTVVWRDPGDVRFRLTSAARAAVPSSPAYAFLGGPGTTTWLTPQNQKPDVVWIGWNTEALTPAVGAIGPVTWSLDAVDGPGRVSVFTTDAFGTPSVVFDSGDGLPDRHEVPLGVHAHGNWAFSAPGTYTLRFTHRASVGGVVQQDARSTTVVVDDVAPGPGSGPTPTPGGGAGGTGSGSVPGPDGPTGDGPAGGDGPGPGGPAGGGTAGTKATGVSVRSRTARMSATRRVALRVRCVAAGGACRGGVTLRTASRITLRGERRAVRVGRAAFVVPAGTTRTVRARVPKRLAADLRRRPSRTLRLRAAVRATADGARRTAASRVVLRVR
jgi:surface-anchored protein